MTAQGMGIGSLNKKVHLRGGCIKIWDITCIYDYRTEVILSKMQMCLPQSAPASCVVKSNLETKLRPGRGFNTLKAVKVCHLVRV